MQILCHTRLRYRSRNSPSVYKSDMGHPNRSTSSFGVQLRTVRNTCQEGNRSHKPTIMLRNSPSDTDVVYKHRGWSDMRLSSSYVLVYWQQKEHFVAECARLIQFPESTEDVCFCRYPECKTGGKFAPRIPCRG